MKRTPSTETARRVVTVLAGDTGQRLVDMAARRHGGTAARHARPEHASETLETKPTARAVLRQREGQRDLVGGPGWGQGEGWG